MQLNPVMESFYLSSLDYSGMKLENNIFVNKNEKLGDITIDGKHLTLPYFDNLKNNDNKVIFHLLNENYTNPENSIFNLYKKRLTLELNLRLSSLIISLVTVASDVQLQQKIKPSKLIKLISDIGEVDHSLIENFLNLIKASKKVNDEAFIFDIFLKKNGEIKDVPYAAIGKINFHMYNEINKPIEDKDREYKVYGYKLRKKDLLAFNNIFNVIFPSIDDKDTYVEGTDNKIFRYLNILLKSSYQISHRLNELVEYLEELNEPLLNLEEIKSNLDWVKYLEKPYEMPTEIRIIPNQVDISIESNKLRVNEDKASNVQQQNTQQVNAPTFDPSRINQPQAPTQQPVVQPQRQLTPEEIIQGSMGLPVQQGMAIPMQQQPMMAQQPMQQVMTPQGPMMVPMQQPQPQLPLWAQQEIMSRQQASQQPMQPQQMLPPMQQLMQQPLINLQQPMMAQQPMQQVMTPQGPMMMPMQQQPMMMQQPMQSGLQVNPMFLNRNQAPYM